MKMRLIGKSEISFIDIVREAGILSQPKYNCKDSAIRKISDRITDKKLNCLELAKAYQGFYEKQYLQSIAFQYGNKASVILGLLRLCPKFRDRYQILKRKNYGKIRPN